MSAALVAVTAIGGTRVLHVQSEGQGAIEVASSTTSFADGADVTIDDAAIQTQGGVAEERRVVKEFTSETPFSMVGLTWEGERDIAAFVRSERADGTWSEWFEMDHADSVPTSPKFGTEPIYVEPTTRIQVSTANVDLLEGGRTESDAPTTAHDIEAVFLDGGEGLSENAITPVAETYAEGMPNVISRAAWGAGYNSDPTYTEVTAATVHHTAGSNNYTEAQAPGIVRGIWNYHANQLGWGDVGYNAMVDKFGNIYEGRTGGLDRGVQGAHVGGFNQNTWGVSMLGNYEQVRPTPAALQAMGEIIGWKAAVAGFDPNGRGYHFAESNFSGSRYNAGQGAYFPNINAHRDFHFNACPGDFLYNEMGTIRNIASQKANSLNPGGASGSITNPDGSNTTVTGSGSSALQQLDLAGLVDGDPTAIALAAGTLAGVLILFAAQYDLLPSSSETVGGVELLPGLTVDAITPYIGPILEFTGNGEAAEMWERFQPLLGNLTGTAGVGGSSYAFFEHGIGIMNSEGDIRTLAGKIADAWLQQGADGGPLGLPTSDEYSPFSDIVRVDFQGGHISYDPESNSVNIDVE
ncbi:N-acetylmuramoyl-L-alanine amidase [Corynebacterium auris]|uniref:N-acetylmuramoyl-L-alanine amidase n=1 Tax=Corynebacterium auris TaxID=44750 RepID=UPI0025B510B8|nr:N-acetylmuramoyl-L-alanine amidase [Corynebacterium auris]